MRKLTLTALIAILSLFTAVPLSAAPRCRKEWTAFNCAVWQLGVDESEAYKSGGMSYEQFVMLTDAHADIFWAARGQEKNEHSHDMYTLGPKVDDYLGTVTALRFLRVISEAEQRRLIFDLAEVEKALNGPGMWFGDPKAPAPNLGEDGQQISSTIPESISDLARARDGTLRLSRVVCAKDATTITPDGAIELDGPEGRCVAGRTAAICHGHFAPFFPADFGIGITGPAPHLHPSVRIFASTSLPHASMARMMPF